MKDIFLEFMNDLRFDLGIISNTMLSNFRHYDDHRRDFGKIQILGGRAPTGEITKSSNEKSYPQKLIFRLQLVGDAEACLRWLSYLVSL